MPRRLRAELGGGCGMHAHARHAQPDQRAESGDRDIRELVVRRELRGLREMLAVDGGRFGRGLDVEMEIEMRDAGRTRWMAVLRPEDGQMVDAGGALNLIRERHIRGGLR